MNRSESDHVTGQKTGRTTLFTSRLSGYQSDSDVSAHTHVNYKCGSLSGTKIRAAPPAELVHQPGAMAYSGSIRRNNERLLSRRR